MAMPTEAQLRDFILRLRRARTPIDCRELGDYMQNFLDNNNPPQPT